MNILNVIIQLGEIGDCSVMNESLKAGVHFGRTKIVSWAHDFCHLSPLVDVKQVNDQTKFIIELRRLNVYETERYLSKHFFTCDASNFWSFSW